MNLTRLNIVLGVLLGLVSLFAILIRADHTQPNWEFLPEMKRSPAWKSYEANPNFANGRTLQPPVAGTISRGELPLYYAATKEDALRAGEELKNPYLLGPAIAEKSHPDAENLGASLKREQRLHDDLPASIQRGAANFRIFCACCHGAGGMGDGPVAKRGFPPPPPLPNGKSVQMKDGQIFHLLTYGQGSMAPMAAQLSREDRWDLVNYIRTLQPFAAGAQQASATNAAPPDTPKEDEQ